MKEGPRFCVVTEAVESRACTYIYVHAAASVFIHQHLQPLLHDSFRAHCMDGLEKKVGLRKE